nr:hypothetical protein B0A51_02912 [Rachicladosporium sp. CCFEE 5018]
MLNRLDDVHSTLDASFSEACLGLKDVSAHPRPAPASPFRMPADHAPSTAVRAYTTLLDLPPQIRAEIYALCLSPSLQARSTIYRPDDVALLANDILPVNSHPDISHFSRPPALALVSSALRVDVLEWWYSSHNFLLQVHNTGTLKRCQTWLQVALRELGASWLRNLRLRGNLLVYDRMHIRAVRTFPEVFVDLSNGRFKWVGERDEGVGGEVVDARLAAFEQAWTQCWEGIEQQRRKGWMVESLGEVLRVFVAVSADAKAVNGYHRR